MRAKESADADVHTVRCLPRIVTRRGCETLGGSQCIGELGVVRLGDHSWGDVAVVRPGEAEDDDTPRG